MKCLLLTLSGQSPLYIAVPHNTNSVPCARVPSSIRRASMRRREFITLIGGVAATWPVTAHSQEPSSVPKIGFLTDESLSLGSVALQILSNALSERGYAAGHNVSFESRYA